MTRSTSTFASQLRRLPGSLWVMCAAAAALSVIAELIGSQSIHLGPGDLIFFPFVWAIILGGAVGLQRWRPVSLSAQRWAVYAMEAAIMIFLARLGALIGPELTSLGGHLSALWLQELGHIFGTVIIALPIAVALRLGRTSIGATYSIDREPNLAFMAERYGGDSDEYRGALSVYVVGSIIGAVFISMLAGYLGTAHVFSPLALALGAGVGSGSMMAAATAALSTDFPTLSHQILAYGGASNLITEVLGVYITIFISLPLAERLYPLWNRLLVRNRDRKPLTGATAPSGTEASEDPAKGESEPPAATRTPLPVLAATLAVIGVIMLLSNTAGTHAISWAIVAGMALLVVITVAAFGLNRLFRPVPTVFWASAIPLLLTASFSPIANTLNNLFTGIDFLAMVTPALAFVGLSIGKDIVHLRQAGWRLLVVALVVYTASYISASAIAEFFLRH
jgi:hypothetical protein